MSDSHYLVIDLQYFPAFVYINELSKYSHGILEQYDRYRKMSFRNRCTVMGANGPIQLSIPLVGGRDQRVVVRDLKMANGERWQSHHWKTLESCYNKSPWFHYFRHELEQLYGTRFTWLVDWNMACLQWLTDKLSIRTALTGSEKYEADYGSSYVDRRDYYLPATINLVNPSAGRYPQVFEDRFGFVPNLSALDRLFCAGASLD